VPLTNVYIKIHLVLLFTLRNANNIAYHLTEVLIFYAYKLMVMGNSKNFNSNRKNLMLAKYTCFTVLTENECVQKWRNEQRRGGLPFVPHVQRPLATATTIATPSGESSVQKRQQFLLKRR